MSLCRGCGSQIEWIKTTAGRNMPVDPEPVFVIEGDGRDRFVTDDGAVIVGRRARPGRGKPRTYRCICAALENLPECRGLPAAWEGVTV